MNQFLRLVAARSLPGFVAAALALAFAGCASQPWNLEQPPGVSPSPEQPWTPPEGQPTPPPPPPLEVPAPAEAAVQIPASLIDLIDEGLRHHPDTRAAWLAAQSAAASLAVEQSALFPTVDITANANRSRNPSLGLAVFERTTYGPFVELSYLLLDFGGRKAQIEQARAALLAADWTHNAAIADRVLAITAAHYAYQGALALAEAERAVVKESTTTLEAAEARRHAGVATLSDVLQARTALSRAELALMTIEGEVATLRGELNTAVGRGAAAPLVVEPLPGELPASEAFTAAEAAIASALALRPEIAAADARVRQAEARLEQARAQNRPTLSFFGSVGRTYFTDPSVGVDTYTANLALRWPVFTGWAKTASVSRARADLDFARARAEAQRQRVELEVFRSFQTLRTATQRVRTTRDLVDSATENQKAALGRYQAGVGGIIELLAAQSALEDARAQEVQSRADFLTAAARLARDSGSLAAPPANPAATPVPPKGQEP